MDMQSDLLVINAFVIITNIHVVARFLQIKWESEYYANNIEIRSLSGMSTHFI